MLCAVFCVIIGFFSLTTFACFWTSELFKIRPRLLHIGPEFCTTDRPGLSTGTFSRTLTTIRTYHLFLFVMTTCSLCYSHTETDQQSYLISDLGPDLMTLLPERLQHEVLEESICSVCFEDLLGSLHQRDTPVIFSQHDINSCVWCHRSLARRSGQQRRSRVLQLGPIHDFIATTTNSEIPLNARICYACWFRAHRQVIVDRNRNIDTPSDPPPIATVAVQENCIMCNHTLFGYRNHLLTEGPERIIVGSRIHPTQIPENARVCHICWCAIQRNIQDEPSPLIDIINEEPPALEPTPRETMISLDTVRRVSDTSSHCFVPYCIASERYRVPFYIRKKILRDHNIYIPKNCRVCEVHKGTYNWEFLTENDLSNEFSKNYIDDMLQIMKKTSFCALDFENIQDMNVDCCKFWLGVNIDQFLLILIESNIICSKPKVALGLYLLKMRTGESIRRIATLMRMAPSQVCKLITKARKYIYINFVPQHLGINHLPSSEFIEKNLIIPKGLFANANNCAITICDGTYIYIQKSSNYLYQKSTYSLHKYRNLVKPLLLVASDGYILDVFGPYGATVSDADIMQSLFQNENHPLRTYFQREDVFILDKGFRDALPLLRLLGFKIYKPESLQRNETQLSTLAANKSRCVTLCRWVIEVVNGRFKRDFKIFRSEYFNVGSKHLMIDFKVAAALINSFHPAIEDKPDASQILNRAVERLELENDLGNYVVQYNLNRRRASFRNISTISDELNMFPRMTMTDLVMFSLGIYQIRQARSYYGEHIRQHGTFIIEVSDVEPTQIPGITDGLLIRGRIRSRHQASKVYYTYILIAEGGTWEESIKQYYCSCICGKRTVGCCAHTMTIVWYLGWARHEENIEIPAAFLDGILIREEEETVDED